MRLQPTFLVCAIAVAACGVGSTDAERLISRQAGVMNDMAAVLEGIDNAASAKRAQPEMRSLGGELAQLQREWQEHVATVGAEDAALQVDGVTTPEEIAQAQARLTAAFTRLAMNPALRKQMAELARAMGDAYQASP